jgi:hypothetical protein
MAFLFWAVRVLGAVLAIITPVAAGELVWKTEDFGANCREIPAKADDPAEGDHLLYRCESRFGPPMWQLFQEGVRQSIGFGDKPHVSMLFANADRWDWPVSWGGEEVAGKFTPLFAVARFTFFGIEPRQESLIVFRLMGNGTSCVVGDVKPAKDQNLQARKIAEDNRGLDNCADEVTLLD